MTSSEPPRLQMRSARNILGSGVVLGIAGGLLLWLMGYVGPIYFLPIVIVAALVGGVLFGVPGYLFERKVNREREEAHEEAEAQAARERRAARAGATSPAQMPAPAGTPVIVLQVGGSGGPYAAVPAQTVMNFPGYGAVPTAPFATSAAERGSAAAPGGAHPGAKPTTWVPPTWPLDEPLCVMETNREKDVWTVAQRARVPPEKVIGFTTLSPEEIAQEFGVLLSSIRKVSRVEGEENVDPGNLEKIGNIIERHLEGGEGRVVVLPALENLVEAGNVRNVRRLLEVVRDLAQGSKGSMLVSLDPVSLPEANVSLLERGAFKLRESDAH